MTPGEQNLSLSELRRRIGRSQAEVALAIGTTQSGVSRLERQPDMLLSTLDEYVSAMGGRLRLLIEHPAISAELAVLRRDHDRREPDRDDRLEFARGAIDGDAVSGFVHLNDARKTGNDLDRAVWNALSDGERALLRTAAHMIDVARWAGDQHLDHTLREKVAAAAHAAVTAATGHHETPADPQSVRILRDALEYLARDQLAEADANICAVVARLTGERRP